MENTLKAVAIGLAVPQTAEEVAVAPTSAAPVEAASPAEKSVASKASEYVDLDVIFNAIKPVANEITLGSISGFCTGYAAKKLGKAAAFVIGLGFLGIQGAAYSGYINVNWLKVQKDLIKALDTNEDGKIDSHEMKHYMEKAVTIARYQMPTSTGFVAGLLVGIRSG
eukprot:Opistho-2@60282